MTALTLTREFALYSLGGPAQFAPAAGDAGPLPFSPARYSRYKYGSVTAADSFARALVTAFGERHPGLARAPRLVMTSSPYTCVPTAATTLARRMRPALNEARARYGLSPVPLMQVDRIGTSAGDYGTLSAAARDRRMAASTLSFRRFAPDQVRDAHLLVIDDVRVTGAHQRCLMRASEELPLESRAFLYIASFSGQAGDLNPTLEDGLNHAAVKTLDDLAQIVEAGDFAWNVRVCKFVLSPVNRHDLPRFLGRMSGWFVRSLCRFSSQDGYADMGLYAPSHAVVSAELARRYGEEPAAVSSRRRSA
ncbi:MAG TPA: phosphoribosyltransferase family protein [Streptosporangiaceae bacterium]|nr:phosphoribosyltransferase family protein [Streptosporangiaceae bacterium]